MPLPSVPNEITVPIGEMAVADGPAVLVGLALGTCVAILLWDPSTRRGGLLHAQLPSGRPDSTRAKTTFVDPGIDVLLAHLAPTAAAKQALRVYVVGGAQTGANLTRFRIGARNLEAAYAAIGERGLRLTAERTGGHIARTVRLYCSTGAVDVSEAGGTRTSL